MFNAIRFRIKLARLHADKRKVVAAYEKSRRQSREEKWKIDDIHALEHAQSFEIGLCNEEISNLISMDLIEKAERLHLPLPEGAADEIWETGRQTGQTYLTDVGIIDLRRRIRDEENEDWKSWDMRLKVIGALSTGVTGLVGTLIGFFAIIHK